MAVTKIIKENNNIILKNSLDEIEGVIDCTDFNLIKSFSHNNIVYISNRSTYRDPKTDRWDIDINTIVEPAGSWTQTSFMQFISDNFTGNPLIAERLIADGNGRSSPNTVFGDKIVGVRKAQISAQFQYSVSADDVEVEIVSTGGINTANSLLTINTGTAIDGMAKISSADTIHYVPGQEVYCYFTAVFSTPKLNSYQQVGIYDDSNGFYVGYHNDEFCFTRRRSGVEYHNVIDLAGFNQKNNYIFNPQAGNIYKISYGYLGFAPISLEVMTPDGSLVILHKIKYPNSEIITHTTQTFLPVRGEIGNTGNDTDISLSSGSLSAGIVDGSGVEPSNRQFSYKNDSEFVIGVAENTLVAFRIKDTFNGIPNKVSGQLMNISGANDINKTARWAILIDPSVLNTPTWTDVDVNDSTVEYSTDILVDHATGKLLLAWNTARSDSFNENVVDYNIVMRPDRIAVFILYSSNGVSGFADLSIRWRERF